MITHEGLKVSWNTRRLLHDAGIIRIGGLNDRITSVEGLTDSFTLLVPDYMEYTNRYRVKRDRNDV